MIVILPVGILEAHGPHAALGNDFLIPAKIAEMLDAKIPNGAVLWPLAYGYDTRHIGFSGTLSLRLSTFEHVVQDIVRSLVRQRFRRFVVVNGHQPNLTIIYRALEALSVEENLEFTAIVANWWEVLGGRIKELFPDQYSDVHGGVVETSALAAVDEKLVGEIPHGITPLVKDERYHIVPSRKHFTAAQAVYASPEGYDPEKGMQMLEETAAAFAKIVKEIFSEGE